MKIKIGKNKCWDPLVLIKNLLTILFIILLIWMTVSYVEVTMTNTDIHAEIYPELSNWNFWGLIGGL